MASIAQRDLRDLDRDKIAISLNDDRELEENESRTENMSSSLQYLGYNLRFRLSGACSSVKLTDREAIADEHTYIVQFERQRIFCGGCGLKNVKIKLESY